jgi:integrase
MPPVTPGSMPRMGRASVHVVLGSCLSTALRKGLLATNPLARAEKVPSRGESDHGKVLDQDELRALVDAFRDSVLFPIVAVAAFTGARRGEILALRWGDLDVETRTLRIERSVDHVKGQALALKPPKTARGIRTITIDDGLIALLLAEREKHLRIVAGVPDGVTVDLSLVKPPADALMFPNPPGPGEDFSFTKLRNPSTLTVEFTKRARQRGFDLRFHDLRGTHETLLLDAGVPVALLRQTHAQGRHEGGCSHRGIGGKRFEAVKTALGPTWVQTARSCRDVLTVDRLSH